MITEERRSEVRKEKESLDEINCFRLSFPYLSAKKKNPSKRKRERERKSKEEAKEIMRRTKVEKDFHFKREMI